MGTEQELRFRNGRHTIQLTAVAALALLALPARGQPATPLDSLASISDTVRVAWTNPFAEQISMHIPARTYAFELTQMLAEQPATFVYDLGPYGWPHGYSSAGISPQHVSLRWNGIEVNDLFTGRPQFELLPLNSAEAPVIRHGDPDGPTRIDVTTRREYEESGEPLTELSYQTSNNGLQKVFALHTQNRRLGIGATPGVLNVLFSYGGEGADGEYPGSRIRQGRQVYGRLNLEKTNWSLQVGDLYNKRTTGAHGGVVPRIAGDFDSVYQRLGASVVDSDALRETSRNDVFAILRRDPGRNGQSVTTASARYSGQRSEYRRSDDTLTVRATRVAFDLSHARTGRKLRLAAEVTGSISRAGARSAQLSFEDVTDSRLLATGSAAMRTGSVYASARAGIETRREGSQIVAHAAIRRGLGPVDLRVAVAQSATPVSLLDRTGLGDFLQPAMTIPLKSYRTGRASITLQGGPLDLTVIGTVVDNPGWVEYFGTVNSDSIEAVDIGTALRVATAALDLGFRRHASRGFYLTAQPTLFGMLENDTDAKSRYGASLPDFYASARFGARYLIFRGDLDLDISVRGRFWSEFTGRSFHTQTGILAIQTAATRPVESSATLDLIVEGGIRAATLFLAYENFLAGSSALPGNLIVPVYPLADKRLRFGVFWPIGN